MKNLANSIIAMWDGTNGGFIMNELKPFSEDINIGLSNIENKSLWLSDSFKEFELKMGPSEWNKLKLDIARWKKAGGILRAKLGGKKETKAEQKKRVEKILAEKPLTQEKEDELCVTPGVVPPSWIKSTDPYKSGGARAIEILGNVSAKDVTEAIGNDLGGEVLSGKDSQILEAGWGIVRESRVGQETRYEQYLREEKEEEDKIANMLKQGSSIKEIREKMNPEKYDFTDSELKRILLKLGVSKEELKIFSSSNIPVGVFGKELYDRVNKLIEMEKKSESNVVPFGEFYHRDVGWY